MKIKSIVKGALQHQLVSRIPTDNLLAGSDPMFLRFSECLRELILDCRAQGKQLTQRLFAFRVEALALKYGGVAVKCRKYMSGSLAIYGTNCYLTVYKALGAFLFCHDGEIYVTTATLGAKAPLSTSAVMPPCVGATYSCWSVNVRKQENERA